MGSKRNSTVALLAVIGLLSGVTLLVYLASRGSAVGRATDRPAPDHEARRLKALEDVLASAHRYDRIKSQPGLVQ